MVDRTRLLLPALLVAASLLPLACTKAQTEAEVATPEHGAAQAGEHGADGHHGHHAKGGHHEVNELGYRGHRFDDAQAWSERFDNPERDAWQKPAAVVEHLALRPDMRVADLGAGTGYFAVRFAAAVPEGAVFAVDIEPTLVEHMGARAEAEGLSNLQVVLGQPDGPGLGEAVDVMFMCDVFHHLADPEAYFRAAADELAPGGRVVIVDFRKDNPDDAPGPPAAMRMSVERITEVMAAAGYERVGDDPGLLPYQYVLSFARAGE